MIEEMRREVDAGIDEEQQELNKIKKQWPEGCIYKRKLYHSWEYPMLLSWHGWACPFDDRECPGRTFQVEGCDLRHRMPHPVQFKQNT